MQYRRGRNPAQEEEKSLISALGTPSRDKVRFAVP